MIEADILFYRRVLEDGVKKLVIASVVWGVASGRLQADASDAQVEAHFEELRANEELDGHPNKLIGDDLSDADLDDLWAVFGDVSESRMNLWWYDKPHQIAYRLVLRLTRAEKELAEIKAKTAEGSGDV